MCKQDQHFDQHSPFLSVSSPAAQSNTTTTTSSPVPSPASPASWVVAGYNLPCNDQQQQQTAPQSRLVTITQTALPSFGFPLSGYNQPMQRCRSMVVLIGSASANQPAALSH
jgi:hypothetical protein